MKRTFQPRKIKTLRKRGFLVRMATKAGQNLIKRRKLKGRVVLSISDEYRRIGKKPKDRNK